MSLAPLSARPAAKQSIQALAAPLKSVCKPQRRSQSTHGANSIKKAAVVGSGQMGLGIAYVAALRAQSEVLIYDAHQKALDKGLAFFDSLLEKDVKKSKISQEEASAARSRIKPVTGLEQLGDAELIIEAAPEKLEIKQSIFRSLAQHASPSAILASNTSSISLTKIAASAITSGSAAEAAKSPSPSRVLGLHFFNPVPVMKLVELISALQTDPNALQRAKAFAEACGKTVAVSQDSPGFVSNRVLMPMINEAIMCLESGIATKDDIDTVMKLGMAHPMGPLQLADFIGLDTCLSIMEVLHRETGDSKYRPSTLLARMVDAGYLGKKVSRGFYEY